MTGYRNKPAETAEVMRPDGWMRTNDIARMDAAGYVYLLDRQKFMIITGAVNVFPATVEAIVYEHPAVAEVAVVGAPHPDWGEAVVAFVRLREGAEDTTAEELTAFCSKHLSKPEVPKHILFVDDLPKTVNQKVMKQPLKQRLLDDPSLLPWPTQT
jgi:acyl-CoA synthetase (AMP-forming)/AMP-acid ligase II